MRKSLIRLKLVWILAGILAVSFFQVPEAHTAEETLLDKAKVVLNDLVGINLTKYTIYDVMLLNPPYFGVLPTEEVIFRLNSSQGSLRASCAFVNDRLYRIYFTEYVGSVSFNQPAASVFDMTKRFLESYQVYTGNPFYGELRSMLDTVTGNESTTETIGNVKFESITRTIGNVKFEYQKYNATWFNKGGTIDSFVWMYTSGGVVAATNNLLLDYRDGLLKCFMDKLQFSTIGGEPKISREEAIAIALKALRNFSYNVNTGSGITTVSQFKIAQARALSLNYAENGTDDGLILMNPAWLVGIGFDKHYPGYVTGVMVRIWADTGNLDSISPTIVSGVPLIDEPTDTTVPNITVLSPENKSYATNSIVLNFATSEPVSWVDYSLNGGSNVTIADEYLTTSRNILLTGLPEGSNTLKVYAGDTYGSTANIGASDTIYFNVAESTEPEPFPKEPEPAQTDSEVPEPSLTDSEPTSTEPEPKGAFPTAAVIAVIASVAAVVSLSLIVRFKKRNR